MTKVRVKYTRTKFDSFATNFVIWIVTETPQFISINVQILHRGWDRGCAVAPAKVAPSCFLADEKKQGGGLSAWVACSHLRGPSRKSPKKNRFSSQFHKHYNISNRISHAKVEYLAVHFSNLSLCHVSSRCLFLRNLISSDLFPLCVHAPTPSFK